VARKYDEETHKAESFTPTLNMAGVVLGAGGLLFAGVNVAKRMGFGGDGEAGGAGGVQRYSVIPTMDVAM
jgi:hypothetical protein